MNKFFILFSAFNVLLAGSLLVSPLIHPKKVNYVLQTQLGSEWKSHYDNKINKTLLSIKKEFKIPAGMWQKMNKQIDLLKTQDPLHFLQKPLKKRTWADHPLTKKIVDLLISYNLNPQAVTITIIDDPQKTMVAFTKQHYDFQEVRHEITVNYHNFKEKSPAIQEAILRHEIQHLINYDSIQEGFLWNTFCDLGYSRSDWDNHKHLISLRHLKELRADQQAAISGGIQTAQAIQQDFLPLCECESTISHPAPEQRVAQMNVVLNQLNGNNLTVI